MPALAALLEVLMSDAFAGVVTAGTLLAGVSTLNKKTNGTIPKSLAGTIESGLKPTTGREGETIGSGEVPQPDVVDGQIEPKLPDETATYNPYRRRPEPIEPVYDPNGKFDTTPGNSDIYWNEFGNGNYRTTRADYLRQEAIVKQMKADSLLAKFPFGKPKKKKTKKKKRTRVYCC